MLDEQLYTMLSSRFPMKEVADFIKKYPNKHLLVQPLLRLCQHENNSIAFRAAWYLEQVVLTFPDAFSNDLQQFLVELPHQSNYSILRHFTKIFLFVQSSKSPKEWQNIYAQTDYEPLIGCHFEWLIDPNIPVAIKANCMEILANYISQEPWIKNELQLHIELMMEEGSPAILSRGRKVLKTLKNHQNNVSGLCW